MEEVSLRNNDLFHFVTQIMSMSKSFELTFRRMYIREEEGITIRLLA